MPCSGSTPNGRVGESLVGSQVYHLAAQHKEHEVVVVVLVCVARVACVDAFENEPCDERGGDGFRPCAHHRPSHLLQRPLQLRHRLHRCRARIHLEEAMDRVGALEGGRRATGKATSCAFLELSLDPPRRIPYIARRLEAWARRAVLAVGSRPLVCHVGLGISADEAYPLCSYFIAVSTRGCASNDDRLATEHTVTQSRCARLVKLIREDCRHLHSYSGVIAGLLPYAPHAAVSRPPVGPVGRAVAMQRVHELLPSSPSSSRRATQPTRVFSPAACRGDPSQGRPRRLRRR